MEGTLGAADWVPFREGIREAALHGGGSAKAGCAPGKHVDALFEGSVGVGSPYPCRSVRATKGARADRVGETLSIASDRDQCSEVGVKTGFAPGP